MWTQVWGGCFRARHLAAAPPVQNPEDKETKSEEAEPQCSAFFNFTPNTVTPAQAGAPLSC
jgi:hypothetical protein